MVTSAAALALAACRGDQVGIAAAGGGGASTTDGGVSGAGGTSGGTGFGGAGGADGGSAGGSANLAGAPSGGSTASGGSANLGGAPSGGTSTGGLNETGGVSGSGGSAGACSADLMTSAANCGRCGHNCGVGSTCDQGLCTPVILELGSGNGFMLTGSGILLDGDRLYYHVYTDQPGYTRPPRSVRWISTGGGPYHELSSSDEVGHLDDPADDTPLAVDGTNVYWFSYLSGDPAHLQLRSAPKDGSAAATSIGIFSKPATGTLGWYPEGMAVDANYVYWLAYHDGLYRFPKTGPTTAQPELMHALPGEDTFGLWIDAGWLYWASLVNGQILRYGLTSGGNPSYVDATSGGADVCALDVDGATLYWAQCGAPFNLRKAGVDGANPQPLATAGTDVARSLAMQGGVVVDDQFAYFVGSDYLHRVPKTGGQTEAIGHIQDSSLAATNPRQLVGVDGQYVYVVVFDAASYTLPHVLRLAK
jgi:hypothetical protein